NMLSHRHALIPLLLVVLTLTVTAQSRREAKDSFDRGSDRYVKGDFDGAIADFTRAIEISGWRGGSQPQRQNWSAGSEPSEESTNADRIMFIDPLIARAYVNRGMARVQKGDLED